MNSIAGRSRRKFKAFLSATSVLAAAGAAVLLLSGSGQRNVGVSQEHCNLARDAKQLSFDAWAEQSASRQDAVQLLSQAESIWAELESSYWPSKFSWALPNGEHAYFETVLNETAQVRDLLDSGEILAAELAERELAWKLRLLPQLCPIEQSRS